MIVNSAGILAFTGMDESSILPMDPERIEAELKFFGISVGYTGIYNIFKKRGLNKAKARLEWVRKLSLRDNHLR